MRVLLINTSERIGGAAVAASRLMEALKNNGIKAKLLVRDKQTEQSLPCAVAGNWYGSLCGSVSSSGKPIASKRTTSLPWTSQTQALTSPPCPNSNRPTSSTFIGSTKACTTCGPVQASATTRANVKTIGRNVVHAPSFMEMGIGTISPIASSVGNNGSTTPTH